MKYVNRDEIKIKPLPGRALQLFTGQVDATSYSEGITSGFAHYSVESGPMSPHRHAEEIVYILDAKDAWTRYGGFGDEPNELGEPLELKEGMILHFPENEWHVFGFAEGGHLDISFFYADPSVYSNQ